MDSLNDDFLDNPNTSGSLEVDGTATGTISSSFDSDWFAIDLTSGDSLRVSSDSFDAELVLRDEFGHTFASGDRDFNTDEFVVIADIDVSGTYFVDVTSFTSNVDYTLTASLIEDNFGSNINSAGVIELGTSIDSAIDFEGDADWFEVNLTAGDFVRFETITTNNSNGFEAELNVRDEFGNHIFFGEFDAFSDGFAINGFVEDSGTYFIEVNSIVGTPSYTLSAAVVEDDFAADVSTTGTLELESMIEGAIDYSIDNDWIAIDLTAGDFIRIETDTRDVEFSILDASGQFVNFGSRDFDASGFAIVEEVEESGTFYISLMALNGPTDYTLSASSREDDFSADSNTTGRLEVGGTIAGLIEFENDVDWIAIDLTAGDRVQIQNVGSDAEFTLVTESGEILTSSEQDIDLDTEALLALVEESGTYYIEVDPRFSTPDYILTATLLEDDFAADTSTTGIFEIGGMISGAIDFEDDVDWIAVNLTATDIVTIETVNRNSTSLRVLDADGNLVESVIESFREGEVIVQSDSSGIFYVEVSALFSPLNYTLTSSVMEDDFTQTTGAAGLLEVGATAAGETNFADDRDWFAINLTAGETIRIISSEFTASLNLLNASGELVSAGGILLRTGQSQVTATVEESGVFYVEVSGRFADTNYTLTAIDITDDFASTPSTEGTLEIGGTATGALNFQGDSDWFAITIEEEDTLVQFTSSNQDVSLSIFDSNGDIVSSFIEGTSFAFSETGTYFVSAFSPFDDTANYEISAILTASIDADINIEAFGLVDTVANEANNITYSLSSEGTLFRFSEEFDATLPVIDLGVDTSALSVSQDGRHIFVAHADLTNIGNDVFEATVTRIDATTLDTETFSFEVTGNGYDIRDIQAVADGSLFVTTGFPGSGSVPFYNLSGFDTTFSANVVPDVGFVQQDTTLDVTRDGQFLLFAESNISSYPVHIYSVADGEVIASTGHGGFNFDRNTISGEAELVVAAGFNDVSVYDFNLNTVADLTSIFGNAAEVYPVFSQNGEYLFLLNDAFSGSSTIAVLETSGFETVSFINLPSGLSTILEVDISADGRSLLVTDVAGVQALDLTGTPAGFTEGTSSSETLSGTDRSDIILGLNGNDILSAGGGDDYLEGGSGADTIDGGEGIDTASYESSTNRVVINAATNSATSGHASGDSLISIENITGSNFNDAITGDGGNNVINGGNGFDVLSGFHGDDWLEGGAGRDLLTGGTGADILDGGDGVSDMGRYNTSDAGVSIDLGAGTASGGHAEGDVLSNIEQVLGSNHADSLTGNGENNFLFGSGGDDVLDGAGGIDKLFGGAGADTFVFGAGDEFTFVTDWEDNVDSLDLTQYDFASLEDVLANFDQRGAHVRFFVEGETLLILNANLEEIADDIIFDDAIA